MEILKNSREKTERNTRKDYGIIQKGPNKGSNLFWKQEQLWGQTRLLRAVTSLLLKTSKGRDYATVMLKEELKW